MKETYELQYYSQERSCDQKMYFDSSKDVFLKVASFVSGEFSDCEVDFDTPEVQDILLALKTPSPKKLIKAINAYWQRFCGGEYFVLYNTKPPSFEKSKSFDEVMNAVWSNIEKARKEWEKWESERSSE